MVDGKSVELDEIKGYPHGNLHLASYLLDTTTVVRFQTLPNPNDITCVAAMVPRLRPRSTSKLEGPAGKSDVYGILPKPKVVGFSCRSLL